MSQLLKNILARGFLARNINANTQISNISKLTQLNCNLKASNTFTIATCSASSRAYSINAFPTKSFDFKSKRNNDYDMEDNRSYGYGKQKKFEPRSHKSFSNRKPFEKNFGQIKQEQLGMEDAEPVETNHQAADYGSEGVTDFSQYNLPTQLADRLKELGYTKPFEIQQATLKHTLNGRDLIGKAFTGSGKTLAFAIPIIAKILNSPNKNSTHPKCLILSPTRELCLQLQKCIQELAPYLKCLAIYGGTNYESQLNPLRGKVDIVCATPGRLRDLMRRNNFVTSDIETICLDEADELLNPNFQEQIDEVIEMSNKKQMLMFSATINKNVMQLVRKYMDNPEFVDLTHGQKHKLPSNIEHCIINTNQNECSDIISHLIKEYKADRCIVFTSLKKEAIMTNYILGKQGIKSSDLHSDLSQSKRQYILDNFRNGRLQVLIATDVAARGIDIPEVNLVIQIGFPTNGIEYYIHRSGRCGRGGRVGTSILIDNGKEIDKELYRLVRFKQLTLPESLMSNQRVNNYQVENIMNESDDYRPKRFNQPRPSSSGFNKFNNGGYNKNRYTNNNQYKDDDF